MNRLHRQKGEVTLLGVIIVFVVLLIVGVIVVVATSQTTPPPPSQQPGASNTCFTYSLGFLEFQCGDNKFMGGSFGIWDCRAGTGAHQCK